MGKDEISEITVPCRCKNGDIFINRVPENTGEITPGQLVGHLYCIHLVFQLIG